MKFKTVAETLENYQMYNFDEAFTDNELLHIKKMIIDYAEGWEQIAKDKQTEINKLEKEINKLNHLLNQFKQNNK